MKKIGYIISVIAIIAFIALIIIICKILFDLKTYRKCFIDAYDKNYNYDICVNYLDY